MLCEYGPSTVAVSVLVKLESYLPSFTESCDLEKQVPTCRILAAKDFCKHRNISGFREISECKLLERFALCQPQQELFPYSWASGSRVMESVLEVTAIRH